MYVSCYILELGSFPLTLCGQKIVKGMYHVLTIGPELLLDNRFHTLFSQNQFIDQISRIIVDEAHTVLEWGGSFRSEYLNIKRIYCRFMGRLQWYLTSATLTYDMAEEVLKALHMPKVSFNPEDNSTLWLRRTNDRPNLHYMVRQMESSIGSCYDLAFLIPKDTDASDGPSVGPFLVYCNSRQDTMRIGTFLHSRLPPSQRNYIRWVHSGMSDNHRKESIRLLEEGKLIGLICTMHSEW